ncbi:MAG: helix-turn-helix domain-containing protein [Candidatus Thiodiazotropha sp. (ex Lucinoma kastoroae)]|nr:helix-turn-helix domain-containing protein [Candidatus Thiodiazotropha sp. (ex Lucinoma kastoroae)]
MKINAAFGKALRRCRKAKGLTQEDFALISSRTYLSTLERGLKSPTLEKIDALARILGIHPLTLLTLAYKEKQARPSGQSLHDRVIRELDKLSQIE